MTDPDFTKAILDSVADPDQGREWRSGRVPEPIVRQIASFAARRARRAHRVVGATPILKRWHSAAQGFWQEAGRLPTVRELAGRAGRSQTAAHAAIVRLRALGLWGPGEEKIEFTEESDDGW